MRILLVLLVILLSLAQNLLAKETIVYQSEEELIRVMQYNGRRMVNGTYHLKGGQKLIVTFETQEVPDEDTDRKPSSIRKPSDTAK